MDLEFRNEDWYQHVWQVPARQVDTFAELMLIDNSHNLFGALIQGSTTRSTVVEKQGFKESSEPPLAVLPSFPRDFNFSLSPKSGPPRAEVVIASVARSQSQVRTRTRLEGVGVQSIRHPAFTQIEGRNIALPHLSPSRGKSISLSR